jgi:Ca2+-binding EF-hand superfamily protein
MIRRTILLLAAVVAASSVPATAQTHSPIPTPEDERQLTAMFRMIDVDRNGRVTKVEMSSFGAKHNLGTIVRNDGWRDIDANRNGTFELREFIVGMVKARADGFGRRTAAETTAPVAHAQDRDSTPADLVKEIDRYFAEIDLDKDKRLTKLEMSTFATQHRIGVFVRPEVWRKLDADHNGSLSRSEFGDGMMELRAKRLAEAAKGR